MEQTQNTHNQIICLRSGKLCFRKFIQQVEQNHQRVNKNVLIAFLQVNLRLYGPASGMV